MKTSLLAAVASLTIAASPLAYAQSAAEHEQHHPAGSSSPAQTAPTPPGAPSAPSSGQPQAQMPMGQMMQGMPEQCRAMMQNMPESCRGMMQQMMGGMRPGGMMSTSQTTTQSEATKAYLAALDRMHGPMMEGVQASDADVAFVRGMIAHHQGAIDMARVRLQYGKDEQTKKWAEDVIRDQQREINEMQAWLQKNAK